jgi:hypothetical protein
MQKPGTKTIRLALIVLFSVGLIVASGMTLGLGRFLRDKGDIEDFKLVRSIGSPSGREFALHFEHTPHQQASRIAEASQQIVVIDSHSNISIPELWARMKANQAVLIESGINQERLALVWPSDSSLRVECSGCAGLSAEILRRAPSARQISIEYVGFPLDAPYTNLEPVER